MAVNYSDFRFDEKNGLFYGDQPVADFNLSIEDKEVSLDPSGVRGKPSYLIEASYTDGRPRQHRWTDTLKKIDLFELFEINDSFLSAGQRKLILSKLMQEAVQITGRFVVDSHEGLQAVQGIPVFVFGEHTVCHGELPEKYEIHTHHSVKPILSVDRKGLLSLCEDYINLLPGTSEILFFGALSAVVKPFCSILNMQCSLVISLVAPSGHLKTTLARIYAIWLDKKDKQETSFCALQRNKDMLDNIDHLFGQNFLIDDLHKMSNANEEKRQEHRLDIVSRHVDAKNDCANVILTGETLEKMGIFSCLDRIFQVRMPGMDAVQIEDLKIRVSALHPNVMPSAALAFAGALMQNYESVLKDIQVFYEKNISNHNVSGYATRAHKHAMFIRMTEYLFGKYLYAQEAEDSKNKFLLQTAIDQQYSLQQTELQRIRSLEEPHDYIKDFFEIILKGTPYITVYGDQLKYSNSKNSCLIWREKIYITSESLKEAFFRRYNKYVSPKLVIDALHQAGLLEEEPGSKGRQKNFGGRKHYVISLRYLISYLDSNNYPVSRKFYEKYIAGHE